jgi:hypothetical protein
MTTPNNWKTNERIYQQDEPSPFITGLPIGVYKVTSVMGNIFLEKQSDNFTFDYPLYSFYDSFVKRVVKTYKSLTQNFGILLNGVKGTSKTVTAKLICNEMKLPVLLVTEKIDGLPGYLSSINQDIIVFFDEYEKVYGNADELLTVMDGVLGSSNRRMFIMTTNESHISSSMLQRPGRIRYIKTFNDLDLESIQTIVDSDLLIPDLREECIEFISRLQLITVDIVKCIIQEVNIHGESPEAFKDIFNVRKNIPKYDVYVTEKVGQPEKLYKAYLQINPERTDDWKPSTSLYAPGHGYLGNVVSRIDEFTFVIETTNWIEEGDDEKEVKENVIYRFERCDVMHRAFSERVAY